MGDKLRRNKKEDFGGATRDSKQKISLPVRRISGVGGQITRKLKATQAEVLS